MVYCLHAVSYANPGLCGTLPSQQDINGIQPNFKTNEQFFRKGEEVLYQLGKDGALFKGTFIAYHFLSQKTDDQTVKVTDVTGTEVTIDIKFVYDKTNPLFNNLSRPPSQAATLEVNDLFKVDDSTIGKVTKITPTSIELLHSSDEFDGDIIHIRRIDEKTTILVQLLKQRNGGKKLEAKYFFQKGQSILHNISGSIQTSEIFERYQEVNINLVSGIKVITPNTQNGDYYTTFQSKPSHTKPAPPPPINNVIVTTTTVPQHSVEPSFSNGIITDLKDHDKVIKTLAALDSILQYQNNRNRPLVEMINNYITISETKLLQSMSQADTDKLNSLLNETLFQIYYGRSPNGGEQFIDTYRTTVREFNAKFHGFVSKFQEKESDSKLGFLSFNDNIKNSPKHGGLYEKLFTGFAKTFYNEVDIANVTLKPSSGNEFKKIYNTIRDLHRKRFVDLVGKVKNGKFMIDTRKIRTNRELLRREYIFKFNINAFNDSLHDGYITDLAGKQIQEIVDAFLDVLLYCIDTNGQTTIKQEIEHIFTEKNPDLFALEKKE